MWTKFCLTILLLTAATYEQCWAASLDYETAAADFLDAASSSAFELYNKIANETFNAPSDAENFEAALGQVNNVMAIAAELSKLSSEAGKYDANRIQNEEIKRALKEIRLLPDMYVLGNQYFSTVLSSITDLEEIAIDEDIKPYMNGANRPQHAAAEIAYDPHIIEIIKTSHDAEELKYYWQAWRDKNSIWASEKLEALIAALRKAAKELGLTNLEFWYRSYRNSEFSTTMEKVMQQLKPMYQQLHAFTRHQLQQKYGANVVDASGPLPDHLLQQVLQQAWTADSVLEKYFPFGQLPNYDELMQHMSAKQMLAASNRFYSSMGFTAIDEDFIENHSREIKKQQNGADCTANIFDKTPQVKLFYCPKVDFRKFMQMHAHLSRAYYAKQKAELPYYYFNDYDLAYPLGEAIILSASSPKHLSNMGIAKNFEFDEKVLLNRLLRMGVHTLFSIPQYFVLNKVLEELLTGAIGLNVVNRRYWSLMEQYAGIEPPCNRDKDDIDFPYIFYNDIEYNHQTRKFIAEILGYQFYRAFCLMSFHSKNLHNCDFYGNEAIGSDIRNMMALGSSKSFAELIRMSLGEHAQISADALLDYYQPMLEWLKAKNKEANVNIGWSDSKKKIL